MLLQSVRNVADMRQFCAAELLAHSGEFRRRATTGMHQATRSQMIRNVLAQPVPTRLTAKSTLGSGTELACIGTRAKS